MRINLIRIRWMNLLSYGNIFTEFSFTDTKTSLLIGRNGGGKTTLIDAISLALFNKPFRPVRRQELVNTITGKDTLIELEFETPQHQYLVRRGISPGVFEIYRDGDLVQPPADAREYQAYLEQILGMTYKTFMQIVVLGSTNYTPFMKLKAAERREVVEDLLDVQVFSVMNSLLKEDVDTNKTALAQAENELQHAIKMLEVMSTHRTSALENINEMIADKIGMIEQIEHELEDLAAQAKEKDVEARKIPELKKQLSEKEKEIQTIRSELENLKWRAQTYIKEQKFLEEHEQCTACGQQIHEEFRQKRLTELHEAMELLLEEQTKFARDLQDKNKENVPLIEACRAAEAAKAAISNLVARGKERKRYLDDLEREIASLQEKFNETSGTETGEVLKIENEITEIRTRQADLRRHQEVLKAAQLLLKDGGVRAKVVRQYIPILNNLINKYLALLDFFVDFNLDEEFKETIRSRFRDTLSYDAFSEGEKLRINLAIMFAWRALARLRSSAHVNVLVMDEILDSSLDAAGADEFIKVLLDLPKDEHVFVISHRGDQLTDKFDRTLIFNKEQNFSQMSEYQ